MNVSGTCSKYVFVDSILVISFPNLENFFSARRYSIADYFVKDVKLVIAHYNFVKNMHIYIYLCIHVNATEMF